YDCIKHRVGTVVNGTNTQYITMFNLVNAGLANNASYENLQQYLDLPWFIDYMIMNFWAGNDDWAHQNWYCSRKRQTGAGWRYLDWDAEHVLKSLSYDNTTKNDANGPTAIFTQLRSNNEFRLRFRPCPQALLQRRHLLRGHQQPNLESGTTAAQCAGNPLHA